MAFLYILAGANHFFDNSLYQRIMPPWLCCHDFFIAVSGVFEILLGLLLLFPLTTRAAAWGIIGLLIAVFPANLQMMINFSHAHDPGLWLTIARLPLQGILIWWAYGFTKGNPGKVED